MKDEEKYREQLGTEIWAYVYEAGVVAKVTTNSMDHVRTMEQDLRRLRNELPWPPEGVGEEAVRRLLEGSQLPAIRALRVDHLLSVMKLAMGEEADLPDLAKERRRNRSDLSYYMAVSKGIHSYLRKIWPEPSTCEEVADRLGLRARVVRRTIRARDTRVFDFLILMRALGHHPITALRDLASEIEAATQK